jgi:hypothetical protein
MHPRMLYSNFNLSVPSQSNLLTRLSSVVRLRYLLANITTRALSPTLRQHVFSFALLLAWLSAMSFFLEGLSLALLLTPP